MQWISFDGHWPWVGLALSVLLFLLLFATNVLRNDLRTPVWSPPCGRRWWT